MRAGFLSGLTRERQTADLRVSQAIQFPSGEIAGWSSRLLVDLGTPRRSRPLSSCLLGAFTLARVGLIASASEDPPLGDIAQRAQSVLANEAAIDSLRRPIGELTRSIQNLSLPGERARSVFSERFWMSTTSRVSASTRFVARSPPRTRRCFTRRRVSREPRA